MDAGLAELEDFGCPAALIDLLRALPSDAVWSTHQSGGQGEFHIISAGDDAEGAIYIDTRHLMVALDPEDARALMAVLNSRVEQCNPTTWRVRVSPGDVEDPTQRARVIEALGVSLRRSAERSARNRRARGGRTDEQPACCPVCQRTLPATGICDDHGRPESSGPAGDGVAH